MYRVLSLPGEMDIADKKIAFEAEFSFSPDGFEYFEERQYQYACLGLSALRLARDLRNTYSIQPRDFGDWNPEAQLQEKKDRIDERRKKRKTQPIDLDEMMVPNSTGTDELTKRIKASGS
jgi:hypothetical protein